MIFAGETKPKRLYRIIFFFLEGLDCQLTQSGVSRWICCFLLLFKNEIYSFPEMKNDEWKHDLMFSTNMINYKCWLVSLFNGISTLFRLFNAKAILLEEQ